MATDEVDVQVTDQYASADDLIGSPEELVTEDITLPNGKKVTVRGMSRFEYMLAVKNSSNDGNMDAGLLERHFIRFGMVKPALSIGQVEAWTKNKNNKVFEPVTEAIRRLSGIGEDADKSDVPPVRE